MWLDKDDLETIAIGYTTAVEVITEKVVKQIRWKAIVLRDTATNNSTRQYALNKYLVDSYNSMECLVGSYNGITLKKNRKLRHHALENLRV